jgi:hypothetical protein
LNLLHSWNTVSGSENGQIKYDILKSWIVKARELCAGYDRIEIIILSKVMLKIAIKWSYLSDDAQYRHFNSSLAFE